MRLSASAEQWLREAGLQPNEVTYSSIIHARAFATLMLSEGQGWTTEMRRHPCCDEAMARP